MEEIRESLKQICSELFGVSIEPEVTVAPDGMLVDGKQADFSSNVAMRLTRELHRAPVEIATEIAEKMTGIVANVAKPGFLNFILPDEYFLDKMKDLRGDFGKNISCDEYSGKTVICEFSDPNPFKVLHVGHLYTSIVGDAIAKLVEFAGGKVVRANFGGDVGLHVAKTLWAVMRNDVDTDNIEMIAKCYVEGTRAYEDDADAHKEIVQLNKEIYRIAAENLHDSKVAELYWRGRETSYQYFNDFYARVGVKFDKYYPESQTAGRGLATILEHIEDGVYEKSDGAVVFHGENYDLHTRVFVNAEGLPTYEAKDVGLLFTKWDDYHFDKSIVITGNDIIEYMKVVLKSVEQYAPELVERTLHLTHGNVRLPGNEKMSSRKGNFIKAVDVLDAVEESLREKVATDGMDDEFAKIALGATKYAFLKYKIGGNIEFDVNESVSMTGNAGPYLQYSAVRANKILNTINTQGEPEKWQLNEHERSLLRKIFEYQQVIVGAVKDLAPHKVANYLYELAQEFSRFYEHVKVSGSEYELGRGKIVTLYRDVMVHGLKILGIDVPEKM